MLVGPDSRVMAHLFRAFLAVSAAACCTECRTSDPTPPAAQPVLLAIGTSIPRAGDAVGGVRQIVRSLTVEGPIAISATGRPMPRQFDSWQWEDHSRTLRLHVRPGVKFHDGTPLTSGIAAEILRGMFFDKKRRTALSTSVASVQAAGNSDVLVRTGKPEGFLISDIAGTAFGLPGQPSVGVGPFVYSSPGPPIELKAFDQYHLGRPAIDRIRIAEYDTHRAAWAAMMRGEINMLYDVARDAVDFVQAESTVQSFSFLRPYYYAVLFNARHPILRRKEVRQALNEAVDRDALVKTTLRGRGLPASGPIWPEHWAYSPASQQYRFNPDAARLRFDAIGLPPRRSAPGRMPSRLRFDCLVIAEDERFQRTALVVQKQLSDIGVDMEVTVAPLSRVAESMASGSFDAVLFEFAATRSLGFVYSFWHSPQPGSQVYVNTGYTSADAALDSLRAAIEDDQIRVALGDVQRVLFEDPPALFLTWPETTRAVSREFAVPTEGARDIVASIRQWHPVAPQVAVGK
jgi:peptide/nickel transport system substrate-binding protein